jgi:hypothetical protein
MNRTIEELALDICKAREWNPEDVNELVTAAGLGEDWTNADGDVFEDVITKAADVLNVRIFPAQVSIDNGEHWYTVYDVSDIMPEIEERGLWQALVNAMDDDTRETVHALLAPCEDAEFLEEYLYRAPVGCDLCIG